MTARQETRGFDRAAAVTRSLLGYGVLSGVFYLVVGIVLGLTRTGFDFSRHALSLLTLGDYGWLQRANLVITGAMVIAAAVGFRRALEGPPRARSTSNLLTVYAACLVGSGIFTPDPMRGFPPGSSDGQATLSGILHLAFGAVGFVALALAAFTLGRWYARNDEPRLAAGSRISAWIILAGFVIGAALAAQTAGVVALWISVVVGWAWFAAVSIDMYKRVPHPLVGKRTDTSESERI
jgi:hypothetical protein